MLHATFALFVIAFALSAIAIYWAILNHRRYKLNLLISNELTKIIENTTERIEKTKKSTAEPGMHNMSGTPHGDLFDQPELMATMITVLVHKYGTVRLSMNDFMIPDEEYVSVYVDTDSQEIILSLDHNLAPETQLVNFTKTDDTTFHQQSGELINKIVKIGDLVRVYKHGAIGVVTEIFDDLNPKDPWIRVAFTHPSHTYQWCKRSGLEVIKERDHKGPLPGVDYTGSL